MTFILNKEENKAKQSRLSHTACAHNVENFLPRWQMIATFAKSSYVFKKDKGTERVAEGTVLIPWGGLTILKVDFLQRAEFSSNKCWMSLE